MMETRYNISIPGELVGNYFGKLVNMFYKILPMKENAEPSLPTYLNSLMFELVGAHSLMVSIKNDSQFLTLLSILENLIIDPDCDVSIVKREVFRGISICNKLKDRYGFYKVTSL